MPKNAFFSLPGKKQDDFFDLALDVFAQQPYHQASLSSLLKNAGIPKGTFYQYFSDKLDLYDHLVSNVFTMKQFYLKSRMPQHTDDFYRYFETLLRLETGFRLQHPAFHSLIAFASDPRLSPFSQDRIREMTEQHQQMLHTMLVRNQLKGSVVSDADAAMVTFCCQLLLDEFHHFVRQRIQKEKISPDKASGDDHTDWIADSSRQFMKLFRRSLSVQKTR